jgi:glycosyltransferase
MKISIITVVYNNQSTINYAIESVLNQDYPNIEYIIIDGNSTDGTLKKIQKYKIKYQYIK